MKLYKGAANLLADRAYKSRAPTTVTFQVTDRCNYSCAHCYQEHVDDNELTTDEIYSILEQLADEGVLFLTLMGGEYFMRRDADAILARAHELGFALKLLSTGHHIHDRRADFLATCRPLQVDMSLYGATPHIHEEVTRQSGSWKRTYEAAKRLIERNIPVLLKAPVMENNVDDLEDLVRLATSIGARYSFDPKITAMENGDQSPVGLRIRAARLAEFYREDMAGHVAAQYENFDPKSPLRPLNHTPCRAGQQACSINPKGEVWPCNSLPLPVGNLREQTFKEIWHGSESLEEIRGLRWASISECNECELRSYCQRCHGMALVEHGVLKGPSLEACRHAVAVRDSLRDRGLLPDTETQLPPTWARVDADGQHGENDRSGRRSMALRVL